MVFHLLPTLLLLSALPHSYAQATIADCPFYGPDVPAPRNPFNSQTVTEARKLALSVIKEGLLNTTVYGPLSNDTSFSLQFFSLHEDEPFFEVDYTSPSLSNSTDGVKEVDQDSIYRVGSVSKLLTVYIYLVAIGDSSWSEPITKYVPELARSVLDNNPVAAVNWDQITIGSLASHLSGVGRDARTSPTLEAEYAKLGLPSYPPSNVSYCGSPPFELPCDRAGRTPLNPFWSEK